MLPSVTEVKVSVHRSLPQVSDFVGASTDVAVEFMVVATVVVALAVT